MIAAAINANPRNVLVRAGCVAMQRVVREVNRERGSQTCPSLTIAAVVRSLLAKLGRQESVYSTYIGKVS
jgi:hypothetical protein